MFPSSFVVFWLVVFSVNSFVPSGDIVLFKCRFCGQYESCVSKRGAISFAFFESSCLNKNFERTALESERALFEILMGHFGSKGKLGFLDVRFDISVELIQR